MTKPIMVDLHLIWKQYLIRKNYWLEKNLIGEKKFAEEAFC